MRSQHTEDVLTSKEILSKTGISRATLNNYIKMGILPKPVVQKGVSGVGKTKLIGHFPVQVIDRIEQVRQLKAAGNNMNQIIAICAASPIQSSEQTIKAHKSMSLFQEPEHHTIGSTPIDPSLPPQRTAHTVESRRIADTELHLSISDIDVPAYLVNYNFEIEWINQQAEQQFFKKNIRSIVDIESRNIFKLFFSWEFHTKFSNWQTILKSHMTAIKSRATKDSISQLYKGISESEVGLLQEAFDTTVALPDRAIQTQTVDFISSSGRSTSYQLHSIYFREGILFIHIPAKSTADALMGMLSNRGKIINDLLKQRMPSLVSLCVLVADLQDSVKISAELPPEEYFQLINEMWQKVTPVFEKYHGIFGKHAGDGILYYFFKKPGADYIMEAINCSVELREKMKELSSEWRIKKNWSNELILNCGLNEGQEFFGTIHAASHIEYTALGDSINTAGRLSDYARNGAIWTTKNVINKLSVTDRSVVNFGITRRMDDRHIFSKNSFARIVDLLEPTAISSDRFMDIATLPVTEVTGIMKQISI